MANIYVRKTGSDSGSGPYLTITKALNVANSGDTIIVGNGIYNEQVDISDSDITLRAENIHGATISGKSGTLYSVRVRGNNITIKDFVINYEGTNFGSSERNHKVYITGDNCTVDNNVINSTEIEKTDYYFNKWKFAGIALSGSNNSTITNNKIYATTFGIDAKNYTRNLWIEGNEIGWTNQSGININPGASGSNNNLNITIIRNTIFDSYFEDGIQTNSSQFGGGPTDCVGLYIYFNHIYGHGENAIDLKGCRTWVIEGNIIHEIVGSNDGYKTGQNRSSWRSLIHGSSQSCYDGIIRNNILYDGGETNIGENNIAIYHNLFINNNRDYTGPNTSYTTKSLPTNLRENKTGQKYIYNNIFASSNNTLANPVLNVDTAINGNGYMPLPNSSNNYAIWDNNGSPTFYNSFNAYKTGMASHVKITGKESSGQELGAASGNFTNVPNKPVGNYENFDFTLKATSGGYDAAIPITTLIGGSGAARQASNADVFFIAGDILETTSGAYEVLSVSGNNITFTTSVPDANGTGLYWRKSAMAVTKDFFNSSRPIGPAYDIGFHEFGGGGNSANFTYTPTPVLKNAVITFTNTSTTENAITTYAWEVDEGTGFVSFGGNNAVETYTFSNTGQVSVRLSVTTSDGTFTTTKSFTVSDENASGCTNNQLLNGEFATDLTNWSDAGNVTPTWVAGEAELVVGASSTANRFFQEFAVPADWTAGAEIAFSFDARTNITGKIIEVEMRDGSAGGSAFANDITFELTTSMATYNGLFTLNATPSGPIHFRFRFLNAGGQSADNQTVYLDNICIGENTQGTIQAVIDPFATTGASPYTITLDGTNSLATNGIDTYIWEIPGVYYSQDSEPVTTVTLEQCCDYDVTLTVTGPDGSSTATETVTVDSCGFTCVGNLVAEPDFEEGLATGVWDVEITGNNNLNYSNIYCSGYFVPTYNDNLGDIFVNINGISVDANKNYNVSFKSYSPFDYGDNLTVQVFDGANNKLHEETVDYDDSSSIITSFSFATNNDTDITLKFLLNGVDSVHIYNVCVTEGTTIAVNPIPPSRGGYVTDTNGNISNYSSHPQFINLFNTAGNPNVMGYLMFSYNIFTGLGQLIEPLSEQVLRFNIDTGDYELLGKNSLGVYEQISTGNSSSLAAVGVHHSLEYGAISRGEGYWNSYQADQVAKTTADPNVPTWVAQPWPTKFEEQYQLAQSL